MWSAVLLLGAWVLLGLVGHDPWKPDEAYTFGLVYHVLRTGDVVVPVLAGQPFMEKPPLYFLTAAGTATLFSPWLPPYDGARLASGLYLAIALAAVAFAARRLFGSPHGVLAALFLAGSAGIMVDAHAMITDTALLAGTAVAFAGLAVILEEPGWGSLLLGTGVGVGFLSKGLLAPGAFVAIALFLPLFFVRWRRLRYAIALVGACAWALPWLLIWPVSLYRESPELFYTWFWVNNFGRFLGLVHIGPTNPRWFYATTLPGYAFPAFPFAGWVLWRHWRLGQAPAGIALGFITLCVWFSVLTLAHDSRAVYAMPMLVPMVVLASPGLSRASPALLRIFSRFSILLFTAAGVTLWLGWTVYRLRWPAAAFALLHRRLAGVHPPMPAVALLLAVGLTLVLGGYLVRAWNAATPGAALKAWVAGLVLLWGLLTTLWLAPINEVKSYRATFYGLRAALPHHGCIASEGLGEPQRALLDYYDHVRTERVEITHTVWCRTMLLQAATPPPTDRLGGGWQRVWMGDRPDDHHEFYALFRRGPSVTAPHGDHNRGEPQNQVK